MFKCPKCGTELEYGMHECDFCFRRLTDKELLELEHQHFQTGYSEKFAKQYQRKKGGKKIAIVISSIVAVIVIIALVTQFAFHKSLLTVIKEGGDWVYQIFSVSKEETEKEKFLRLEEFAEQINQQYRDTEYPTRIYKSYDEYLLDLITRNVEAVYPNDFTGDEIRIKTQNGVITEFRWNGWMYAFNNGYSKVYGPN